MDKELRRPRRMRKAQALDTQEFLPRFSLASAIQVRQVASDHQAHDLVVRNLLHGL